MKHTRQLAAMLIAAAMFISVSGSAAVPQLISYQGRLTSSVGAPLDTTVSLVFTIYSDSTGSHDLWTETHSGVVVQDGLFQVLLGSVNPIIYRVFEDGLKRWLGIQMQGGPAASTLIPIVSVAYSYHAKSADTATYATNGGSSGWTDDGTTVSLSTIGDSVGIGTTNPAFRLDVAGGLRATDSVQTNKLVLGKASTTTGALNLYSSLTSLPIVQLFGSSTGGTVQVRDEAGNSSAFLKSSTEPGGLLSIARNAAGTAGFYVDGNTGTEEPKVSVLGNSRSAIFDMSENGDSSVMLPEGAINSTECSNEAGAVNYRRTTSAILDTTITTIITRSIVCPSDGLVVVIATGTFILTHTVGIGDYVLTGVSNVSNNFELGTYAWGVPPLATAANYDNCLTVHGYFTVDAGLNTFYFLGKRLNAGSGVAGNASMTLMFFPTWYGGFKSGDYTDNPEQERSDAAGAALMAKQIESMRKDFERKLGDLNKEIERLKENNNR
ncbi:MAG: hypothetical protein NT028_06905 [candidate division Zixibacteria bacterium]|nr:hypothetical protein [candidate division Zixibacteria bacterium]